MRSYTIQPGDNLSSIASRFHTTVAKLASLNHIANPNVIHSGATLRIPDGYSTSSTPPPTKPQGSGSHGVTYTVHRGDTLGAIANRFHTSVGAIASANHIRNPNVISVGQRLKINGGGTSSTGGSSGTNGTSSTSGPTSVDGIKVTPAMRRLAAEGKKVAFQMGGYRGQGKCALGVHTAMAKALGIRVYGNGNETDNNLPRSKFRELHIPLSEALKIPGLILTWEHTSSTLGRKYGHTAITQGNGRSSTSDFYENNTLAAGGRSGLKIFLPLY
ncbi:MAG: LysM peptidoglycan-binding domain-containing protein [Myxococcaceae bacterium]|nr:LysM peptidoglycan-binding domain-containing protein [Myxococcaceae bacterium]